MIKFKRPIPSEKIKLLIFDLDGTLVDSRLDLAQSVNAMLRNFGRHALPTDVIASYVGDGAPTLVRRALGDPQDEGFLHEALHYFMAYYREHKLDHTTVYRGITDALTAIQRSGNGVPRIMAVLTNKPVNPSRAIVEALGMTRYFRQVYGGNSFPTKKPDPAGAMQVLAETGVRPEHAAMVGDSHVDVQTGRNAGLYTVGVTYGFAPHTLNDEPPDVLVDTPEELRAVFASPADR